jgi:nucleoside phosphorylase
LGVGTSGSLDLRLRSGDVLASNECLISDWRHEDGKEVWVGPYGVFDYALPNERRIKDMLIKEEDPLILAFMEKLFENGFQTGRILTSDAFVSGKEYKLALGELFKAHICDMESGSFAYVAKRKKAVFLNLRVVADTLDETLSDYFEKESDVTKKLAAKLSEALKILNLLVKS